MILSPPSKADFTFNKDIKVDTENQGFSPQEIKELAGTSGVQGFKGVGDLWSEVWGQGRVVPPEIQDLKSEFGYQSSPTLVDLIAVAGFQNTQLDGVIKAQAARFNFFIMSCGVYISPQNDEKFEALKFEVIYHRAKAATHTMLPGPQTRELFKVSTKADVGVKGNIAFGIPPIPLHGGTVDASAKAQLETNFIVAFEYELKTQVVDAFGVGSGFCKWTMHKGDNLRNDVVFYPIIRVPKPVEEIECEFRAYFKISHPHWKNAEFFVKPPMTINVSI